MPFEWFIAKRYLWSKRRHPFVRVTGLVSVVGIAVGVAALVTVLAVMNGFDEDLQSRIVGLHAHLVIEKDGAFADFDVVSEKIRKVPGVVASSPYVEGQALIQAPSFGSGVLIRGIDPAREKGVSNFSGYLIQGGFTGRAGAVVIGTELAKRARLSRGSTFQVLTQNAEKPETFTVEGIFSSGLYEYDANILFIQMQDAQKLFGLDGASGLSVRLGNAEDAVSIRQKIQKELGYPFFVRTWMDLNRTLFGALKLEKTVMFIILSLIILVACLNIAGSLTLLVMDKTRDIGILKALGTTPGALMKIFAMDGLVLGFVGAGSGLLLGTALSFLLKEYPIIELPAEIYYVTRLPVKMGIPDTAAVAAVAVLLSFLSALYPARMAARLDPVRALRYE